MQPFAYASITYANLLRSVYLNMTEFLLRTAINSLCSDIFSSILSTPSGTLEQGWCVRKGPYKLLSVAAGWLYGPRELRGE